MPLVTAEMNIANALKKANIIPEVVDESFSPSTMLQIQYKKSGKDVVLGNELTPEETEEAPEIMFVPADENAHYTLMLVDPDAPSAQDSKFGPWRHWVLTNIPGFSGQISATAQHQQVTPYFRAAPPAGSGPHRYIFLLYKQMNGANQTFSTLNNDDRKCFNFKQYAQEHQLQLVGINFFYAEKK